MRIMKSRKKDNTNNRDYISNLPNDVMSNILSRLPTKYAVQTCVLSKAWEYKWTSSYNIDINDIINNIYRARSSGHIGFKLIFVNFVDRVLFDVQNFRGFKFCSDVHASNSRDNSRMETWLSTVFRRNVEEVTVETLHRIILPRSLSTCTSLRKLDIHIPCTWKIPINSYFPNLTRLSLSKVKIMNGNSNSDTLLFHFPVLKTFILKLHVWLNVRFVEFHAPSLISFLSENFCGEVVDSYTIKIIGTSLQNFETGGYDLENFLLTGSTVSYAALKNEDDVSDSDDVVDSLVKNGLKIRRLLKEFSSLESLVLTSYLAQALARTKSGLPLPMFAKLQRLVLSSGEGNCSGCNVQGVFEGLFELLRLATVLKSLTIERFFLSNINIQDNYDSDMMEVEPVPSCVVSHLEEVNFDSFGDRHKLHLAMYFLENGAQLKKFSIRCCSTGKKAISEVLSKFRIASTSLEIVLT